MTALPSSTAPLFALGRSRRAHRELTACAATLRRVCDYAKASYVSESIYRDPTLVKGIDNAILLLVSFVLTELDAEQRSDTAGWDAADRFIATLAEQPHLTRRAKRWLRQQEWLWIHLASEIISALTSPQVLESLSESPSDSPVGRPVTDQSSEPPSGVWYLGSIPIPLPDWYQELAKEPPGRLALEVDAAAYRMLSKRLS